jgi:hypothetical protein
VILDPESYGDVATLGDILAAIGIASTERTSLNWQTTQDDGTEGRFNVYIGTTEALVKKLPTVPREADVWFGVNPVDLNAGRSSHRGTEAHVTRLAALYADLDATPGKLRTLDNCDTVIQVVSQTIGKCPVAVIFSGHGLQPLWRIDGADDPVEGKTLLRRFGRLVKDVAAEVCGVEADGVYELARVLRVPGTLNHKDRYEKKVPPDGE